MHHAQDAIIGALDTMDITKFPNGFEFTNKALNTALREQKSIVNIRNKLILCNGSIDVKGSEIKD